MPDNNKSIIFDALSKYSPLQKRNPQEDFLTELFAWLLNNVSGLKESYILFLKEEFKKQNKNQTMSLPPELTEEIIDIKTQVFVKSNERNGFIDMGIYINEELFFACEHKIGSDVHSDQINRYQTGSKYTVLIARTKKQLESDQAKVANIKILWNDIKGWTEAEEKKNEKGNESQVHVYLLRSIAGYLDFDKVEPIRKEQLCLDGNRKIKSDEDIYKTLSNFFQKFSDEETDKLKTECDKIAEAYGCGKDYKAVNSRWVWGRKGIDFFGRGWEGKPTAEGEIQSPLGLFAGILYDPGKTDHYWRVEDSFLEPKGIDLVIILDVTNSKKDGLKCMDAYKRAIEC